MSVLTCIVCVLAGWEYWRWYFFSVYWHGSTWLMQPLDQILLRPMKRITAILQVDVTVWSTGLVSWGTGHLGMWCDGQMMRSFPPLRLCLWSYGTCRRFEVSTALRLRTLVFRVVMLSGSLTDKKCCKGKCRLHLGWGVIEYSSRTPWPLKVWEFLAQDTLTFGCEGNFKMSVGHNHPTALLFDQHTHTHTRTRTYTRALPLK